VVKIHPLVARLIDPDVLEKVEGAADGGRASRGLRRTRLPGAEGMGTR
jgi:hypothetical protein